jgi:hypothetical protein
MKPRNGARVLVTNGTHVGKRGRVRKTSESYVTLSFDDGSSGRTVPKFVETIEDYAPGTKVKVVGGIHMNKTGTVDHQTSMYVQIQFGDGSEGKTIPGYVERMARYPPPEEQNTEETNGDLTPPGEDNNENDSNSEEHTITGDTTVALSEDLSEDDSTQNYGRNDTQGGNGLATLSMLGDMYANALAVHAVDAQEVDAAVDRLKERIDYFRGRHT